jgi:hypothetical protein
MRDTNALLAHPVFQLLGWTLLHFVWQGTLVALAYAGLSLSLRRSNAAHARAPGLDLLSTQLTRRRC